MIKQIKPFLLIVSLITSILFTFITCQEDDPLIVTGNIEGAVKNNESNESLSDVKVTLQSTGQTTSSGQSILTGTSGNYTYKDIEAGAYSLIFEKNGFESNNINLTVIAGKSVSGDVSLIPIQPELEISVTSLDFGSNENSLPVAITNNGKGSLEWSIAESVEWLSVNPVSGKVTTDVNNIVITVNRSGLEQGNYQQSISIVSNGGNATISVIMKVEGGALAVFPNDISIAADASTASFQITNSGTEAITYTVSSNNTWLKTDQTTGTIDNEIDLVNITVDRTGIEYGVHKGMILITSSENSVIVNVTLTVADPNVPLLSLSAYNINFGSNETEKILILSNAGGASLSWSVINNIQWLNLPLNSGTLDPNSGEELQLTIDRSILAPGHYEGQLQFSSNGGNTPVDVIMDVEATPILSYNPTELNFTTSNASQSFEISNTGNGEINWNLEKNKDWISLSPTSGNNQGTVNVTIDYSQLEFGEYSGQITIKTDNAGDGIVYIHANNPQPSAPTVTISAATNITTNAADITGNITSLGSKTKNNNASRTYANNSLYSTNSNNYFPTLKGSKNVIQYGHCWSTSQNPTVDDFKTNLGSTSELIDFQSLLSDLTPNTTYYVRAYAINAEGTAYSSQISFNTEEEYVAAPEVETGEISNIETTTVSISGNIISVGSSNVIQHGHCWSLTQNPTTSNYKSALGSTSEVGVFSSSIANLTPNTTYYSRAYATNEEGTSYGSQISFTSNEEYIAPPEVTTMETQNITSNAADITGNIISIGSSSVITYGHCWSTSANPTVNNETTNLGVSSQPTEYISLITNLTQNTTYYVRAYAINSEGTAYSEQVSFNTVELSVDITAPTNSTQWTAGDTETILWDDNFSDYVNIELYKSNIFQISISSSTVSNGSFVWNIPMDLQEGSDYKIKITSTANSSVSDYSDNFSILAMDEYGNGADGVFTGGELNRNRDYYFSEINMQSGAVMNFTGEGNGGIYVQGNFTLATGATINMRKGENLNAGDFTFKGYSRSLGEGNVTPGAAGTGGNGTTGSGYTGGAGGNGGYDNNEGNNGGAGGTTLQCTASGGSGGNFPSNDGSNGSQCTYGTYTWGGGGGGGAAGSNGLSAEKVAFVVAGNVSLQGIINGKGSDGTNGGNGGNGAYSKMRGTGGGGGGGGGAGGNGGAVYIFTKGSFTNNATTILSGGSAGAGGTGGTKGSVATSYPEGAYGSDGSSGINGSNGIIERIQTN
ncbi:MAG: carboxypeptidase regulatory-like domain-containing protein [Salinivirgaceae bacterium]|nr:carboxypeptidase regulatory-like domain-containing protein [Salinivirgaceae bacterium]